VKQARAYAGYKEVANIYVKPKWSFRGKKSRLSRIFNNKKAHFEERR